MVIVGFALAVLVLGAAILYVANRPPVLVLPRESAAILAMRAEAQAAASGFAQTREAAQASPAAPPSGGNAFPLLVEAMTLLPEPLLPPPDAQGLRYRGEIARLLGILDHSDDDPEVLAYLEGCDAAIAKTRQALQIPALIYPENAGGERGNLPCLCGLLLARALHQSRVQGDDEEALRSYADGLRLGLLLGSDGDGLGCAPLFGRHRDPGESFLQEIIVRTQDTALLRSTLEDLVALNAREPSARRALAFSLRTSPRTLEPAHFKPPLSTSKTYAILAEFGMGEGYAGVLKKRSRRKALTILRDEAPDLLAAADLPYPEYLEWWQDHHWYGTIRHLDTRLSNRQPMEVLYQLKVNEGFSKAVVRGHQLLLALEIYRRTEGAYPDCLDELAPKILALLPLDPFRCAPFRYLKTGDAFHLSHADAYALNDLAQNRCIHAPRLDEAGGRCLTEGWQIIGPFTSEEDPHDRMIIAAMREGFEKGNARFPVAAYHPAPGAPAGFLDLRDHVAGPWDGAVYAYRCLEVVKDTEVGFFLEPWSHWESLTVGAQHMQAGPWNGRMTVPIPLEAGTVPLLIRIELSSHNRPAEGVSVGLYADAEAVRLVDE